MRYSGATLAAGGMFLALIVQQTAGFLCPTTINPLSSAAHRAVGSGSTSASPIRRQNGRVEREGRRGGCVVGGGSKHVLGARRRDDFFYDDDDDDLFDDELDDRRAVAPQRRKRPKVPLLPATLSKALVAGVFVLGIGTGVTVDSAINTDPRDLASRDAIDRNAPNPNICQTYGSSAMVVDQRVFVTFNPFSLHVSQADTKPGCVLRSSNVVEVLQRKRGLLTNEDVETCKGGMNTWGYVGDLNDHPQLSCVYQSDDAQNEFLSNPKYGLGEDVYDDDRAAAAKKSAGSEPANGPRVMSGTVQTVVTDRAKM
ncbi:unnamed protein product [Ectocarpus sp. 13 AM-2016]